MAKSVANQMRSTPVSGVCESSSNVRNRSRTVYPSMPIAKDTRARLHLTQTALDRAHTTASTMQSAFVAASCSSRCRPALLVGSNVLFKPVHIVANLSSDAASHRDTMTSNENLISEPPLPLEFEAMETGSRHPPHYCMDTGGLTQLTVVGPACAASSTSSVVHDHELEAMDSQACTQSSYDGEGGGCINVVTLCNVWRLGVADNDTDSNSMDDHDPFLIPVQESLIGQQCSSYELVIN